MVEESFSGGGKSFRYFTVRRGKGEAIAAATVGELLRYHLWQYEDVSNSGFRGGFDEWWEGYASKHGLPR